MTDYETVHSETNRLNDERIIIRQRWIIGGLSLAIMAGIIVGYVVPTRRSPELSRSVANRMQPDNRLNNPNDNNLRDVGAFVDVAQPGSLPLPKKDIISSAEALDSAKAELARQYPDPPGAAADLREAKRQVRAYHKYQNRITQADRDAVDAASNVPATEGDDPFAN